jgi:hypothetical protein
MNEWMDDHMAGIYDFEKWKDHMAGRYDFEK